MNYSQALTALGVALCALTVTTTARADAPQDLSDLVGARGSSGETQMQARGYSFVRSALVRDQSWSYWWSDVQRQCVSISTMDGRYASIQQVPEQNCRAGQSSNGNDGENSNGNANMDRDRRPDRHPDALTLVCYGEGNRLTYTPHYGYKWNEHRHMYEPTNSIDSSNQQFSSGVQVDIRDGQARIHLNDKLVPPLHSGGDRGWWPVDDLRISSSHITGRYRLNAINRPSFDIDRHSGLIDIKGTPGFSGRCDIGDWNAGRKF